MPRKSEHYKCKCLKCGKEFEIVEWQKRQGRGKYCSRKCTPKLQKGHKLGIGRKFSLSHRKKISEAHKKLIGKLSPRWKGGRWQALPNGYITLLKPNHPNSKVRGYILEHRYMMSEYLGRPLKMGEEVHHINKIKDDNRIENLALLSIKEHRKIHGSKNHKCSLCSEKHWAKNYCKKHYRVYYKNLLQRR